MKGNVGSIRRSVEKTIKGGKKEMMKEKAPDVEQQGNAKAAKRRKDSRDTTKPSPPPAPARASPGAASQTSQHIVDPQAQYESEDFDVLCALRADLDAAFAAELPPETGTEANTAGGDPTSPLGSLFEDDGGDELPLEIGVEANMAGGDPTSPSGSLFEDDGDD